MKYTKEQQAIICHEKGHALVNAVPGSGKTHSLIGRVTSLLVEKGLSPRKLMVVMFNKAAQLDFQSRLQNNTHLKQLPEVRTFHSLAYRMLQRLIALEMVPAYTFIPDSFKVNALCRKVLRKLGREDDKVAVDALQGSIGIIKSRYDSPVQFKGETDCLEVEAFRLFEEYRHKEKLRSYDDLLYDLVITLQRKPECITLFSGRLEHIIVDEYQDVNYCQQFLIKVLAGDRANVMGVGDIDQTIYEFRGSAPEIMLEKFSDDFKEPTHFKLSHTFRFGAEVAKMASNMIAHNSARFDVKCQAHEIAPSTRVEFLHNARTSIDKLLKKTIDKGERGQSVAVLVRQFTQAIRAEMACLTHDIPYQLIGADGLLKTTPIKSILGYLRLADDAEALKVLDKAERHDVVKAMLTAPFLFVAPQTRKELIDRLASSPDAYYVFDEVSEFQEKQKHKKACDNRCEVWDASLAMCRTDNAALMLKDLRQQLRFYSYFEFSSATPEDEAYKNELLNAIICLAEEHNGTIAEFLTYIDGLMVDKKKNLNQSILITSMHRAKGLEWDVVIIPSLLRGVMPSDKEDVDLEAERRILYVAMTRAKKELKLLVGSDAKTLAQCQSGELVEMPEPKNTSPLVYEFFT